MTAPNDGSHAWRSCRSKRRYATEELVAAVAANVLAKKRIQLSWYKCGVCKCFHLTSRGTRPPSHARGPMVSR